MTILLRREMFDALLNGTKKSTSRLGQRDLCIGDDITFQMTEDNTITHHTKVTKVYYCKFSELTEEEAKIEGYNTLADLKNALKKIYNPNDDDVFTIIHFE